MSKTIYRSPRTIPAEAALIPARLAQHYPEVLWRELPDGEVEVATKQGDRVERLRIHQDGTTSPSGASSHNLRFVKTLCFVGFGVGAVGWLAVIWSAPTSHANLLIPATALLVAGTLGAIYANDLRSHLNRQLGEHHEWHVPTDLDGWTPCTTAQLTAVEDIADEHGGVARIAEHGLSTILVRLDRGATLHDYILDDQGRVKSHETTSPSRRLLDALARREEPRHWHEITVWEIDNG
jgi:hypothetical protein